MGEADIDITRIVELVPDESITDAIGRGHTLATAVADIIDNSLDANAERILIRFVIEEDRLIGIRIRDDGDGMTPPALIDAMTLGKQRDRNASELGHFGIGLKAASLSQAKTLTVYSRNYATAPCALRIHRGSFAGEVLVADAANAGYTWDAQGPASTGTVVEWRDLETINHSEIAAERRSWLERTITSLALKLGLTFHRIIQVRGVRITIDTWDQRTGTAGPPRTVEPRDPFQFTLSGKVGYPTVISASTSDGAQVEAECFILPPRSDSASVWLLGQSPVEWQGIYVYRNDRLLQAGGWLDVRPDDKRLRLARMRVELTKPLERHLRLRHEKSGVTPTPEFSAALEAATNDAGVTLDGFRSEAQEVLKASSKRTSRVKPAVPVGQGLPNRVVETVRDELGDRDDDPISIGWSMLAEGCLFDMRLEQRSIIFNLGYRAALGGDETALVPTLVYLLLESYFTKGWLRDATRAQIDAWQKIAAAAMLAQLDDTAFDPLADWDILPAPHGLSPTNVVQGATLETPAGPRPTPPSVELRWALLGQRGQLPDEADEFDGLNQMNLELNESAPEGGHVRLDALPPSDSEGAPAATDGGGMQFAPEPPPVEEVPEATIGRIPLRQPVPPIHALPGDREVIVMYRAGSDIELIATALGTEPHEIALRLCALLLDLEGDDIDDPNLAALHGQPYAPADREKILEMYRGGLSVRRIAEHLMRTPFAIAWQLLSSPKRPVEVPKNLLRRIDRALETRPGAPTHNNVGGPDAGYHG